MPQESIVCFASPQIYNAEQKQCSVWVQSPVEFVEIFTCDIYSLMIVEKNSTNVSAGGREHIIIEKGY